MQNRFAAISVAFEDKMTQTAQVTNSNTIPVGFIFVCTQGTEKCAIVVSIDDSPQQNGRIVLVSEWKWMGSGTPLHLIEILPL